MIYAPNLAFDWLEHGFGERDSSYPEAVVTVKQIHSANVVAADAGPGPQTEGDALISGRRDMVVAVKTADCVPVLLADTRTRAVAAVHAGWRGTAANIVTTTLAEMSRLFGTRATDVHAAIGPAIGVCCYEVSADVARRFAQWEPEWETADSPTRIDLPRVNQTQLRLAGVRNTWKANVCTRCSGGRFWSFRGQGEQAGRMLSYIGQKA